MRQSLFVVSMVFYTLLSTAQTPFVHIDAGAIDNEITTFHGTNLTKFQESNFQNDSLLINYNPAIPFNGVDDHAIIDEELSNLKQLTVFTIYKPNANSAEKEVWGFQGEESFVGLTTDRSFNNDYQTFYEKDSLGNPLLHRYYQLHNPKSGEQNTDTYMSLGIYKQDPVFQNNYFGGAIAEVIAYKRRVRGTNLQKIESALALKYGITLTNGLNYISSDKEVMWDAKEDVDYTHNILGIGRDDDSNVYQKQSTSANAPEFMVLSATAKAVSNVANSSTFQDNNFVVIGDDNGALTTIAREELQTLERTWLVKATGNQAKNIDTQLQVDVTTLFDKVYALEDYILVINQDEASNFSEDNIYVNPTSLSESGILTFDGLNWDTDKSGKDIFTFLVKEPLVATLESETSLICEDAFTKMSYEALGGIAPYQYTLQKEGTAVKTWTSEDDETLDYTLEDIKAGVYTLLVKDDYGDTIEATYTIEAEVATTVDLGADQSLQTGDSFILTPQISNAEAVASYQWTSDNGFSSTSESIEIFEMGIYTLTVTNALGCEYSDEISVDNEFVREFTLYPNPSTDGSYSIDIEISEKGPIQVYVYDIVGTLLDSYTANNKFKTTVKGKLPKVTGLYEVVLVTEQTTITKKIIVE